MLTTANCWILINLDNPINVSQNIQNLEQCVKAISSWMVNMKLKLNAEKTELLVVHSKHRTKPLPAIEVKINSSAIQPERKIRNLGFVF